MTLTARRPLRPSVMAAGAALAVVTVTLPALLAAPQAAAAPPPTPSALCNTAGKGGLITFPNTTTVRHVFTNAAAAEQFTAPNRDLTGVTVLLVGGGGGGGGGFSENAAVVSGGGAGGGGGQVLSTTLNFTKNVAYNVVVGDGGAGGTGSNSGINARGRPGIATTLAHAGGTATAAGGGGGGSAGGGNTPATSRAGGSVSGGSGGGGAGWPSGVTGGPGAAGTGTFAGGDGQATGTGKGGGGGGAGAAGTGGASGGVGGAGVTPPMPGGIAYAGGGGGGGRTQNSNGGSGGGGIGVFNTGTGNPGLTTGGVAGGGGGAGGNPIITNQTTTGGQGARGTVIIQYARTNACLTVTPTTPTSTLPTLSWSPTPTVTPFTIASWTVLYSNSPSGPWGVFANGGTAAQLSMRIQSTASARFTNAAACTAGQILNSGWTCRFTGGGLGAGASPTGTVYFTVFARLTGGGVTKISAVSAPVSMSVG